MKRFEYADPNIGDKEMMITVPAILIGGGILSLPAEVSGTTIGSDG